MIITDGLTIGYCIYNIIQETTNKALKVDIHSVHSNSFYARVYPDVLLLVSNKVYGALPFGISIDIQQQGYFEELGLERGLPIKIEKSYLYIPEMNFYINLKNACVWYPKDEAHYKKYLSISNLNLDYMIAYSQSRIEKRDWTDLIFLYEDILSEQSLRTEDLDDLNKISFNLLRNLADGIKNKDYSIIKKTLFNLIGFGAGLTPCMDDVVVGLISSLHVFKYKFPALNDIVRFLSGEIYELSNRTTLVSKLYLISAAKGDVFEIIDELIYAVLFSGQKEIRSGVDTLLTVGSTSGAALLLGIILGFKLVFDLD